MEVGHKGVPPVPAGTRRVEEGQQVVAGNCLPACPHFWVVVQLAA